MFFCTSNQELRAQTMRPSNHRDQTMRRTLHTYIVLNSSKSIRTQVSLVVSVLSDETNKDAAPTKRSFLHA
jgi:hypothetical protein